MSGKKRHISHKKVIKRAKTHSLICAYKCAHIHTSIRRLVVNLRLRAFPRSTLPLDRRKLESNLQPSDCKTTILSLISFQSPPFIFQNPLFSFIIHVIFLIWFIFCLYSLKGELGCFVSLPTAYVAFSTFVFVGVMLMTKSPRWLGSIDPTLFLLVRTSGPWTPE